MDLGQRLRQARLDAGLSQRQLCGEEITRNMLSLIENGSAHPSMTTLAYLAKRLGKPISFFLEEDLTVSVSQSSLQKARQAYESGSFAAAAAALEGYREDPVFDAEKYLLEALTAMALARQAISRQKMPFAVRLLESAADAGARTVYYTEELERQRLLLLSQAVPEQSVLLVSRLPEDDRELLLRASAALSCRDLDRSAALLEAAGNHETPQWCFLRGEVYRFRQQYRQAVKCYQKAEPVFQRKVWPLLEQCYRELDNFKMAYTYACKQR